MLKDEFKCLGKNTEKYITFSVPIVKEVANDEEESDCDSNEEEVVNSQKKKKIAYKIQFIDSYRFMSCKLSDLVDNPGIHNKECEKCMKEKKNMQKCKFIGFKDDKLRYKCKECGNKYSKLPNEAIENFPILYQFCNSELNIFFLLLGKGIYPSEYMDRWGKFNEVLIPPKEAFYREGISDTDYEHVQKVWEVFEIKNLGEYHDLYAQSDTVLLAEVFQKFRDKRTEIYGLDPAHFVSAPELAWQACLKITKVELELLTDINMLLMVEN